MFTDFLVVLVSDYSFELHQGLGASCDVTASYLRDDVIEGGCWVCPAEHAHVRGGWGPGEEGKLKNQQFIYKYHGTNAFCYCC